MTRGLGRTSLALCVALWAIRPTAAHGQQALNARALGKQVLRIDGDLRDWLGARFASIGDAPDSSFAYALGYDAAALYVGARVRDDQLVRTRAPSVKEDALVLTLSMPRASAAPRRTEVFLFAGIPGKQPASAATRTGGGRLTPTKSITAVEGPLAEGRGYVLEARIPWNAIEGSEERALARAALALHDVDGKPGAAARELSTAGARGELPPFFVGPGGNSAIAAFLRAKDLAGGVRFDLISDLSGDSRAERVVFAGTYAVIAGPEIQDGGGYGFLDLPVTMSSDLLGAELRDVNGDGKAEVIVHLRQEPDAPRIYTWDGARFDVLQTRSGAPAPAAPTPAAAAAQERVVPAEPPAPAPPGAAELIAAFREARGIDPSLTPRFLQHANVAEDARLESLMLFGKDLLVIGKGFRGGTGYFFYSLPVRDAADVIEMSTADLTSDGRRELLLRAHQSIGDVQRDLLMCFRFTDGGIEQLLAVEIGRRKGGQSVENSVEFVRERGQIVLRIAPGRARGWDEKTYPFVADSRDGIAPLLLPWRDGPVRYRQQAGRLVAEASR